MKMSAKHFAADEANQVLEFFREGIKNKTEGITAEMILCSHLDCSMLPDSLISLYETM